METNQLKNGMHEAGDVIDIYVNGGLIETNQLKNGRHEEGGAVIYYKKGRVHSEDGPAVEHANGRKEWFSNGVRHREGGPAVTALNGREEWWFDGELHRKDGPAVTGFNGTKEWHINGQLHRVDGPAIESATGTKEWFLNGLRHREDGPAVEKYDGRTEYWIEGKSLHRVEFERLHEKIEEEKVNNKKNGKFEVDGDIHYLKNGKLHREDGPAIITAEGGKEWFLDDISYEEDEFKKAIKERAEAKAIRQIKAMRKDVDSESKLKP